MKAPKRRKPLRLSLIQAQIAHSTPLGQFLRPAVRYLHHGGTGRARAGMRHGVGGGCSLAVAAAPHMIDGKAAGTAPAGCAPTTFAADQQTAPLCFAGDCAVLRSEEHTSELQSLMRISFAVFCLKQ